MTSDQSKLEQFLNSLEGEIIAIIPNVTYRSSLPDADRFAELFETTGWNEGYRCSTQELYAALQHTWQSISAYDGERLVGFGRIVSDGVLHALICEMIVAPDYQGQGIGSAILIDLVAKCRGAGVRDVQLFCATGKAGFYARHGFVARPDDAPGMQLRWSPS